MSRVGLSWVALGAVLLLGTSVRAADEALVLRMSAERLAAEGRCEEAIATARRARALAPEDAAAAAIEGHCALQLKRYDEAVPLLETAHRLDPQNAEVAIQLVMAQYHHGDRVGAERNLADAERLAPGDSRVALYKGLLLLQRSEDRAAAEQLERAGRLDPAADPYAAYFAGLAWQRANERQRARESLERARERAAGGPWAGEAERALAQLDAGSDVVASAWVRAVAGMEYDSNVVLRGEDVQQPDDVSGDADGRGVWSIEGGLEAFRSENWAGGVIAGYQGNAHFDLHEFDLQYPTASLWLDRRVDDQSFLRIQPFAGYAWYDADSYLAHVGGEVSYYRGFGAAGSGRLYARVGYQDYLFSIQGPGDAANRDGMQYLGGYEHALPVGKTTTLRAGVAAGAYVAEGRDYDNYTGAVHGGVRQQLPLRFAVDLSGGFAYEPYEHHSIYNFEDTKDRIDRVWVAQAELERPITDWLVASARYRYVDNDSNTEVFDYHRHIAGGYLTVLWTD